MSKQVKVILQLDVEDASKIRRGVKYIKKHLYGAFNVTNDKNLGPVAVITLFYGESRKLFWGGCISEIMCPLQINSLPNSEIREAYKLVEILFEKAKSELVKCRCDHYDRCLDIASDPFGQQLLFSYSDSDEDEISSGWWGFSCTDCPGKIK